MGYLLLSIVSSTLIFVLFKSFEKFGINNLYAIITNYVIAGLLGYIFSPSHYSFDIVSTKPWFIGAICIGLLFIILFQIMALTAQKFGVARVSVAVKMSIVLPVIAGLWLFNESISIWSVTGIILALLAVYLGTRKEHSNKVKFSKWLLALPIILFFGDGMIGVLMKYAQYNWLKPNEMSTFSGVLFGSAFVWGLFFLLYQTIYKHKYPTLKDVFGGILLGIPNFGSIYFLLLALDTSGMPSAAIFPINNVAIVGISAIVGLLVFKEHLSRLNYLGLALGIISILLITNG